MKRYSTVAIIFTLLIVLGQFSPAGAAVSGAIFTTTENGSVVNANQYDSKCAVYLDGGPGPNAPAKAAGLPDGDYYFQVTDPRSSFFYYLYNDDLVHFVLPTKHHRGRVDLLEILVNSVYQLLLAVYTDSAEHRTRHFAELILDQIQPRAVLRREHKDESLGHSLQIAARLFGDVRGMVVQHQPDLMVLWIGAVQLL